MKKILTLGIGLCSMISACAYAVDIKVGVIDFAQITQQSPQVAVINKKLQTQFAPEQQKIMQAQSDLRAQAAKLAPTNKLTDAQRQVLQTQINKDQQNLQNMVTKFQETVNKAQTDAMQQFTNEISNAAKVIAQKEKIDLVLVKNAVVYAGNTMDITSLVLKEMPKTEAATPALPGKMSEKMPKQ